MILCFSLRDTVLVGASAFSALPLKDFLGFVSKCHFMHDVRQTKFTQKSAHSAVVPQKTKLKSFDYDCWNGLTSNFNLLQVPIKSHFYEPNFTNIHTITGVATLALLKSQRR